MDLDEVDFFLKRYKQINTFSVVHNNSRTMSCFLTNNAVFQSIINDISITSDWYRLLKGAGVFSIDEDTGVVTTQTQIDFEQVHQFVGLFVKLLLVKSPHKHG